MVTISVRSRIRWFAAWSLMALAAACTEPLSETGPDDNVELVGISTFPQSASLSPSQTQQFTAQGITTSGTSVPVRVVWDATGGTISDSGLFMAPDAGDYRVIATHAVRAWLSDTSAVTVGISDTTRTVAVVDVVPDSVTLSVGDSAEITVIPRDADGVPISGKLVTWSTASATTATVEGGTIVGRKAGTTTVTATVDGVSATISVVVRAPGVASVVVLPDSVTLTVGGTATLTAEVTDEQGDPVTGAAVTWSSSNGSIATVDGAGQVTAQSTGTVAITATVDGVSGSATVTVTDVPVASVSVSPASAQLFVDETVTLTAVARDADGNPLAGRFMSWSSNDDQTATVNASGVVTAISAGAATITATSEGQSGTATITVSVRPVAAVEVSPDPVSIVVGQTAQLTATTRAANGDVLTGRSVTWQTGNASVATVNGSGVVTAVGEGSTTITARSEGITGTANLTVSNVPIASIDVTPATNSLPEGQTVQLTGTARDASGNVLVGRVLTWSSSNTGVATVTAGGLVTAVSSGVATITASAEGINGTASISVAVAPVEQVTVTPGSPTVTVGGTVQLTAVLRDGSGNVLTGRAVTWTSSSSGIASVNGNGLVTGAGTGTATITATSEGVSGTASVTVNPVPVAQIDVAPSNPTVEVDATVQLTATVRDANGNVLTGRTVTWSSSNASIATVNASGRVRGQGAGTAVITATSEGVNGTTNVTVVPVPVATVDVAPGNLQLVPSQTGQLTATPRDADGNALSGRAVSWSSNNSGIASVSGTGVVTGQAAGSAVITATSEGVTGTASVTVAVSGPPASLTRVSGNNQTGPANTALSNPLVVRVTDQFGNRVPGASVTFAVTAGGGSVAPTQVQTNTNGQAQTTWTLGASGNQQATATVAGAAGSPLGFSATVQTGGSNWSTIFSQDFESNPNLNSLFQDRGEAQNHAVIQDGSLAQSGSRLLRITYPANSGGGWLTYWFGPLGDLASVPDYEAVRISAWMRVSAGFQGPTRLLSVRGSHISDAWSAFGVAGLCPENTNPSFFTATIENNGAGGSPGRYGFYNQWRGMPGNCWSQDGTIPGALATYFPSGGVQFTAGEWHFVEMEVVMNTIGQANGEHRIWLDGVLRGEWTGLEWRNTTDVRLNSFQVQAHTGSSHPLQYMWVDDLIVEGRLP